MHARTWLMAAGLILGELTLTAQTTGSTAPGQTGAGQSSVSALPPKTEAQPAGDKLHPEWPRTNGLGYYTNSLSPGRVMPSTNQTAIAGTQTNLSLTGPGQTNQTYPLTAGTNLTNGTLGVGSTNHLALTNQLAFTNRDQAVTVLDQRILIQLHQRLSPLLGPRERRSAIHFLCDNGRVKVLGLVPSAEAATQIVHAAQEVPGVTAVENGLVVGDAAAAPPPVGLQGGAGETNLGGTLVGGGSGPITPLPPPAITQQPAPVVLEDKAFKATDEELLNRLRHAVLPMVQGTAASMPVHFICDEGTVTVTGFVISSVQKAAVLGAVKRTSGVAKVLDELRVSSEAPAPASAPGPTPAPEGP